MRSQLLQNVEKKYFNIMTNHNIRIEPNIYFNEFIGTIHIMFTRLKYVIET